MIFRYTGREIKGPLSDLLSNLKVQESEIKSDLKRYAHSSEIEFFQWAALPPMSSGAANVDRHELAKKLIGVMGAIRETELFLHEAKRRPKAAWGLTMAELSRLYPPSLVLKTKVVEKSPRLSLWQRFVRLLLKP